MKDDVAMGLATARRQAEHLRARVYAHDDALRPDLVDQLGAKEPRPASDVEDALARRGGQRRAYQAPPSYRVTNPVQRLELLAGLLVKYELAHTRSFASSRPPASV
jgi:hypothetical protein